MSNSIDNGKKILNIKKDEFSKALVDANSIVNKKSPIQAIRNIYIKKENNNKLILSATNLDILFLKEIDCDFFHEAPDLLLQASLITECVKKMSDEIISLYYDNQAVILADSKIKFSILNNMDKFPSRTLDNFKEAFTCPIDFILELIKKSQININEKDGGFVKLHVENQEITMIFFDRRRLSFVIANHENISRNFKGLINMKFISEIIKLKGDIKFSTNENEILVSNSTTHIVSKVLRGNDINHLQFLKNINECATCDLNLKEFKEAVNRVIPTCSSITRNVKISFLKDKLEISTFDHGLGSSITYVNCQSSEEAVLNLNIDYLISALDTCTTDILKIYYKDKNKPVILFNDNYSVIMPIRIN
jgi:DNA polymerase III sliding clamp (beta) subunit (PCNA family)